MLEQILWTACVTPFSEDGQRVDYVSLKKCLLLQERAGNGILLLGSTGESLSLSDRERREIVEFALKLNLQTQIMVGVPSYNMQVAQSWLEFCNDLPISCYLMTTPIYTKPGVAGQTEWFMKLLDQSKHPVMLYNIPGRAGIKLYPLTVKNLGDHERLLAIKDSSGTSESIIEYKIAAERVAVYCGDDYMMPAFGAVSAAGLVSVASNIWPEATRKYVELCLMRQELDAKVWWQACKALFLASNPIPVKALMKDIGLLFHDKLRLPLTQQDLVGRELLLKEHAKIVDWGRLYGL